MERELKNIITDNMKVNIHDSQCGGSPSNGVEDSPGDFITRNQSPNLESLNLE